MADIYETSPGQVEENIFKIKLPNNKEAEEKGDKLCFLYLLNDVKKINEDERHEMTRYIISKNGMYSCFLRSTTQAYTRLL